MNYSVNGYRSSRLFNWSELISLGNALGHKWWMVGTKLRVPECLLDQIASNNDECGAYLLREWLKNEPSWTDLITVLDSAAVGLGNVADMIRARLARDASKEPTEEQIISRSGPASSVNGKWDQSTNGEDTSQQAKMLECYVDCQSLLESHDSSQWEKGIEESSRGIDMCRDGNLSVSNSNEVAMVLHLTRAKLMWKLISTKPNKDTSKLQQLEKCLLDCEEVIRLARCNPKYGSNEYDGMRLAYQCSLVKGDDHAIQQYRRQLVQRGATRPIMLQLERTALEGTTVKTQKSHVYHLQEMLFPKVSFIDQILLDDVIRCYKDRQTVCRNCYYNDLKLSRGFNAKGQCTRCQWEFKNLLVMPKSPLTVNYYKSDMIAIPPWPKSKPNDLPFESCAKPTDKSQEHKRCLVMSRNSAVWYAHTVEELVIWTVEREYGCAFEEYIQQRTMPFHPYPPPLPLAQPAHHMVPPVPPGLMPPANQGPLHQPHPLPPPRGKPPMVGNHRVSPDRNSVPARDNSWSPWSNDLDFLGPPTTTSSDSLKQIWSKPDHTSMEALQNSFGSISLNPPIAQSRQHHNTWDTPSLSPRNKTWSDNQSHYPMSNGYSSGDDSNLRPPYYNGHANRTPSSSLLARGITTDGGKALSRPKSVSYHPHHVMFTSVANIPRDLLQSVAQCYLDRHVVCPSCFVAVSPTTRTELYQISRQSAGPCHSCGQSLQPLTIIPASPLCYDVTAFVAILPSPMNGSFIKCCPNIACRNQFCSLAHSVEELVIWCVELESGRQYEQVFEHYLPDQNGSRAVPTTKRYTLASVNFRSLDEVPKQLLLRVRDCYSKRFNVCKACFYKYRPQTETQLRSLQPVPNGEEIVCHSCNQRYCSQLVIPSCSMCENEYGNFIPMASKGQTSPVRSVEELILRLSDSKSSNDPFCTF